MTQRLLIAFLPVLLLSCNGLENSVSPQRPTEPDAGSEAAAINYSQAKSNAESVRQSLRKQYANAPPSSKQNILANAGDSLVKIIGEDFYGHWKGTPWDYNGTTKNPNGGSIACGYFVTGLLQDAGCQLNRIKLSTCPSLTMMKALTSPGAVKNLSALTYETFTKQLEAGGRNLYIVGLDFHTGFIVNDGAETWFLHSSYINKTGVVKERVGESAALKSSKTRYLACLTKSEKFLELWLLN